jgi:hypothetical protein
MLGALDLGVIPAYGISDFTIREAAMGSYYTTYVDALGPSYGEGYADFSYCVDQRVKFGVDYPWMMAFKLVHSFPNYGFYPDIWFPAEFTVLGAWTNGGYVQDISQPGRFNEFTSESLLLGPIGLY